MIQEKLGLVETKQCSRCKKLLPVTMFDTRHNKCRKCRREYKKFLDSLSTEERKAYIKAQNDKRRSEHINKLRSRTEKICLDCKLTKPISDFGDSKSTTDLKSSTCKECRNRKAKRNILNTNRKIRKYSGNTPWIYKGLPVTKQDIKGYYGFLYLLIMPDGRYYIGQKSFKGNWGKYYGSGHLVTRHINKYGNKGVKRIIIMMFDDVDSLNDAETHLIGMVDAVNNDKYLNINNLNYGISLKGERHPNSKLTESDVLEIYRLLKDGHSQCSIGKKFNVGHRTIGSLRRGKSWPHMYHHFEAMEWTSDKQNCYRKRVLKDSEIIEIYKQFKSGVKPKELAKKFGIGNAAIHSILKGETYIELYHHFQNMGWKCDPTRKRKLSKLDVIEIYRMVKKGDTNEEIKSKFGITYGTINGLITGKSWKHLHHYFDAMEWKCTPDRRHIRKPKVLTESDVLEIYKLKKQGVSVNDIGNSFNIHPATVSHIISGRVWSHLYHHYENMEWQVDLTKKGNLSEPLVLEIYRMRIEGHGTVEIGDKFGVNSGTISRITRGLSWGHLYPQYLEMKEESERVSGGMF